MRGLRVPHRDHRRRAVWTMRGPQVNPWRIIGWMIVAVIGFFILLFIVGFVLGFTGAAEP